MYQITGIAMDLNNAPKEFCDNTRIGYGGDFFALAMYSGDAPAVYALTPQHAKKLTQHLQHKIAEYEERYGEIDAEWSEHIKSPIQSSDISENGNPDRNDSEQDNSR
jgi:hypothetical protein